MNDGPRRRRPAYSEPPRSGGGEFPLIPAIIVVILVGLFLGAVFAHYLAAPKNTGNALITVRPTPLPTAAMTAPPEPTQRPETPSPAPAATAKATPSPSPRPAATNAATPSPRPQSTPSSATATPAKTAPPMVKPVATPTPVLKHTMPVARATEDASAAAAGVVRSYIAALRNGSPQSAAAYLANGTPDQDSFVDAGARITSLSSSRNPNGTYHVDANVVTASGTYAMSFTISASNRITDHLGVKIH